MRVGGDGICLRKGLSLGSDGVSIMQPTETAAEPSSDNYTFDDTGGITFDNTGGIEFEDY